MSGSNFFDPDITDTLMGGIPNIVYKAINDGNNVMTPDVSNNMMPIKVIRQSLQLLTIDGML